VKLNLCFVQRINTTLCVHVSRTMPSYKYLRKAELIQLCDDNSYFISKSGESFIRSLESSVKKIRMFLECFSINFAPVFPSLMSYPIPVRLLTVY